MLVLSIFLFVLLSIVVLWAIVERNHGGWGILSLVLMPIVGTVALIQVVGAIFEQIEFTPTIAKIEQLRKDTQRVNQKNAEDVYGQATMMNQKIVEYQAQNKLFWYDQMIPDNWDNVKLIEIPEE